MLLISCRPLKDLVTVYLSGYSDFVWINVKLALLGYVAHVEQTLLKKFMFAALYGNSAKFGRIVCCQLKIWLWLTRLELNDKLSRAGIQACGEVLSYRTFNYFCLEIPMLLFMAKLEIVFLKSLHNQLIFVVYNTLITIK